jgi:hypothetical protein
VNAAGREVLAFVPDCVRMLRGVLTDSRVPQEAKVEAAAAAAYLASPLHKAVARVPGLRTVDRPAVVALAVRRLLVEAGEPVLREHWPGSDAGFQVVLGVTRLVAVPSGARRAAMASTLLGAVGAMGARRPRGGGAGVVVIDGEVVNRRPGG